MGLSDSEWKKRLSEEQYRVLRQKHTEPPFSGKFDDFWNSGIYKCAGCGTVLFTSDTKYDAGCGWPSFWSAIDDSKIKLVPDSSFGMSRTEVICGTCQGHLGHVFDDGPKLHGGKRFCINSAALDFNQKAS